VPLSKVHQLTAPNRLPTAITLLLNTQIYKYLSLVENFWLLVDKILNQPISILCLNETKNQELFKQSIPPFYFRGIRGKLLRKTESHFFT